MKTRRWLIGSAGVVATGAIGFSAWLFTRPPAVDAAAPPAITPEESAATRAALKPPKRQRPLVAVLGINDATETNDYILAAGVLRRAGVADVVMVATGPGVVALYPALAVVPDATVAEFDVSHPDGADYVIVPAMSRDDDPVALQFIGNQSAKGALIVSVCAGAKVIANAGLLDGKRGTTHWFYRRELLKEHPSMEYVPDRRFVVDGTVVTTTGITASIPMSLTLIEAIAGRERAEAVARDLGADHWDARHASRPFMLTRPFAATVLANRLAFWHRDEPGIALAPGVDEVSLALVADAWSRTYRSRAVTFADSPGPVLTRSGIRIVPDRSGKPAEDVLQPVAGRSPLPALDETLDRIESRYGAPTRYVVAMQLEYPRKLR